MVTFKSRYSLPPYRIENACTDVVCWFAQVKLASIEARRHLTEQGQDGACSAVLVTITQIRVALDCVQPPLTQRACVPAAGCAEGKQSGVERAHAAPRRQQPGLCLGRAHPRAQAPRPCAQCCASTAVHSAVLKCPVRCNAVSPAQ